MLTLFDLTIAGTTYKYSDQPSDLFPAYAPRLNLYSELEEIPGDIARDRQPETVARVWLSNAVQARYTADHPTVSEHIAADRTLVGAVARFRRYDTAAQATVRDVWAVVEQVGDLAEDMTRLTIRGDYRLRQNTLLPALKVRDLYPSVPVEDDLGVPVALGNTRKIPAPLLSNRDTFEYSVEATSITGYEATIAGFPKIEVREDDIFVFEVALGDPSPDPSSYDFNPRLDIGRSSEWLSDVQGLTDQNGNGFSDNIEIDLALKSVQRRFALPATWVGTDITRMRFLCSPNDIRLLKGSVQRARIEHSQGGIRLPFFDRAIELTVTQVSAGTVTLERIPPAWLTRIWQRTGIAASGEFFANGVVLDGDTVFSDSISPALSPRDEGLVSVHLKDEEYDFLTAADIPIQASFDRDNQANPATELAELIANPTFGLDTALLQSTFEDVETFFTDNAMQIGGALTTQRPAGEALADCLFHGARLSRAAAGAVRIDVDELADHTEADIELGAGDPAGWNNFQLDGVRVVRNLPDGYQLFGLYDPGFPNQGETWGAYAQRGATAGNILQQYAPYIADTETLNREAHYRWHRIQQRKVIIEGQIATQAYGAGSLRLGQRIYLTIPKRAIARTQYEILGIERGQDFHTLTLIPWDADIFTYTAGTIVSQITQPSLLDYSYTGPDTPTNAMVSEDAGRFTVSADVASRNITAVVVRVYEAGSISVEEEFSFGVGSYLRASGKDILLGDEFWRGGWSDGTTAWVISVTGTDTAKAFTLSTGARDSGKDIVLGNEDWFGGWSDDTTAWAISGTNPDTAKAFTLSTGARDSGKDIVLGDEFWRGGWSDGTTAWVISVTGTDTAKAFTLSTGARDSGKDIVLGDETWRGGWSDDTTAWVISVTNPDTAKAFTLSTGARDSGKDIVLGNENWISGWSDDTTTWVVSQTNPDTAKAFAKISDIGLDTELDHTFPAGSYDVEILAFNQENQAVFQYSVAAFVRNVTV